MGKPPTFEEQVAALVPNSIDNVIREHRDAIEIRFATPDDLAPTAAVIPASTAGVPISLWNLVCFDIHAPSATGRHVRLFGRHDIERRTFHSSAIVRLDLASKLLVTSSGSLYRLEGPGQNPVDMDLVFLCAFMHKTRLGRRYGVPHIFY